MWPETPPPARPVLSNSAANPDASTEGRSVPAYLAGSSPVEFVELAGLVGAEPGKFLAYGRVSKGSLKKIAKGF